MKKLKKWSMHKLFISTSFGKTQMSIVKGNSIVYSTDSQNLSADRHLSKMLAQALSGCKISIKSIERVILDIGPGGTNSVRSGIAFGNGLAFSLKIPVSCVSSVKILMKEFTLKYHNPIIIAVKSIKGNAFFYTDKSLESNNVYFGDFAEKMEIYYTELGKDTVLVHNFGEKVNNYLDFSLTMEALNKVNIDVMVQEIDTLSPYERKFPEIATPITEQNLK